MNYKMIPSPPLPPPTDAAGKLIAVGSLVVYNVKTTSGSLNFGRVVKIVEKPASWMTRDNDGNNYHPLVRKITMQLTHPDGSPLMKKEYDYELHQYVDTDNVAGNSNAIEWEPSKFFVL